MQQGIIQFDSYAWVSVPREELLYTEAAYIVKFRPRYNTSMVKDKNGMPAQSTMPKPNT
jgi:excinuclease UvrABC nuclease subunit